MAPDADLTVYSTGATLLILNATAAYKHLLANHPPDTAPGEVETIRVTSNSYGSAGGNDLNPAGAQETATGGRSTAPSRWSRRPATTARARGSTPRPSPRCFSSRGRTQDDDAGEGTRWDGNPNGQGGYTPEDRVGAPENVRTFHEESATRKTLNTQEKSTTVGPGTDVGGIAGAPGAGSSTYVEVTFAERGASLAFSDINLSSVSKPGVLSARGSRRDDGQVFTAGQTNQVDVTISDVSHEVNGAKEVLPDGWSVVVTGDGVFELAGENGVGLDPAAVNAANGDGGPSFTYFVEAPASSGSYTLGPVEVRSGQTADEWVTVSGTSSTEYVAGQSTAFRFDGNPFINPANHTGAFPVATEVCEPFVWKSLSWGFK